MTDPLRCAYETALGLSDDLAALLAERNQFTDGHEIGVRIRRMMDECGPDYDRLAEGLSALFWELWASLRGQLGVPAPEARHARDEETTVMEAIR